MDATPIASILIVDNDAANMDVICDALRVRGYQTLRITQSQQALKALQENPFDLLLTDLIMPGMDGVELLDHAQKLDPYISGILMTGHGTVATAVQAMEASAVDYVPKPLNISTLLPVLSRSVNLRRLRLENIELRNTVAIHEFSQAMAYTPDPNVVLETIADTLFEQFAADEASVMLLAEDGVTLYIAAVRGDRRDKLLGKRLPVGMGIAGNVAIRRKPAVLQGEVKDMGLKPTHPRPAIKSALSMPMIAQDKLIGILNINYTRRPKAITAGQIKVVAIFANYAATSIAAAQLNTETRKTEARYREILNMVVDGIISTDNDQRILIFNSGAEAIFGYRREEIIGKPFFMLFASDVADRYRNHIQAFTQSANESRSMDSRDAWFGRRKDGTLVPIEVGISKRSEHGRMLYTTVVRDVTLRVQVEAQESKQYKLAQLESALAKAANEAATPDEALRSALQLICCHEGWLVGHATTFAASEGTRRVVTASLWQVEDRVRFAKMIEGGDRLDRKESSWFINRLTAEKVPLWIEDLRTIESHDAGGLASDAGLRRAFGFVVSVQEEVVAVLEFYAEDARESDRQLLNSVTNIAAQLARVIERYREGAVHMQLAAIVESSHDGIVSTLTDGTIVTWNRGAHRLFGYTAEEIIGENIMLLIPVHLSLREGQATDSLINNFESIGLTKDHRNLALWIATSILHDGAGQLVGYAATIRDITERKEAETQLRELNDELENKVAIRTTDLDRARHDAEEANQAKSMFLATMSHEIRTPMNGVIGMIDVLHQSSLHGEQVEMVDLIRESAFSLLGIINDILDFSKIEAGKLDIEQEAFAIADLVEGVGGLLNNMASKKNVILTVFSDPEIPADVCGDGLRLRQVLTNLISNAIKFSSGRPHAGRVAVRALLVEDAVQRVIVDIHIADNGIGMDNETQARLFSAFTQADASTTRQFGGTGLGLVIANNLVELMGGEITVESTPGAGSVFKVRIPFIAPPQPDNAVNAASDVDGLSCVVTGPPGGLADNLATYLRRENAAVERRLDRPRVASEPPGWRGVSVWVVDAGDEPQLAEQLCAAARSRSDQHQHCVLVLLEAGRRHRPLMVAPGLVIVDGNALSRRNLLRAVAAAAGRVPLDLDRVVDEAGKLIGTAPSREEALRQGRLILIAEDNETNQKVIVRQLALLGYTADIATDGYEALEHWRSGDYALLLTDLHMPRMDGYELTQAIRAEETEGKRITIIALTANALKGEADRCRAVGMEEYRSKPLPLAELKTVLDQWLPITRGNTAAGDISDSSDPEVFCAPALLVAGRPLPLDVNVLKKLVGDDAEFVREYLQDFRSTAIRIQGELKAAVSSCESKAVVAAAHNLKSVARTVGAFSLGELCEEIEVAGKAGDRDELTLLLPRFESELAVVKHYLGGP